jgi:hypothetical protein
VLERYRARVTGDPAVTALGRKGRSGFGSCEDTLMMYGACALGFESGYEPGLTLVHHLDPRRFRFRYMVRLMYGYGRSLVRLERLTAGERRITAPVGPEPAVPQAAQRPEPWLARKLRRGLHAVRYGLLYAACLMALQLGMALERGLQQCRQEDAPAVPGS